MKFPALSPWVRASAMVLVFGFTHAAPTAPRPALLAPDGAWCWFGNPRAVVKDGRVYFGYVRDGDGRVCLNVFDPATTNSTLLWASGMIERDDHDNPGLLTLSDGRMLAIYAKHGGEKQFYYRLTTDSATASPVNWSSELRYTNTTNGVTYANPYQLAGESGRIYNFMRNLNFNPTFVTSDATGTNWSSPTILIKTGTGGTRPYVQYCSDLTNRIDFIYTDAHPGDSRFSSLYHAYYSLGGLYRTDGTFLKSLAAAPLLHDSGERGAVIYQWSTAPTNDPNDHNASGRAWCWDLVYHTNGAPVAAFSVQKTNVMGANWYDDRIYYYYARWTGSNWQKRFIAHAGRPLYSSQRDYAGGISIDPGNPDVVYLASNAADPFNLANLTSVPLRAGDRYEVFRGETSDGGLTFAWQAVTTNSVVDNLRPYVPRKNPYPVGVIWYAGTYMSYTDWSAAVYGLFATSLVPVTVVPNLPPSAQLIRPAVSPLLLTNISDRLELAASATDDGEPGSLAVAWQTLSGPASAVFSAPAGVSTSASFPQAGTYALRFSASDGLLTNGADVTVVAGALLPPDDDPTLALRLKLNETSGTTAFDSSPNHLDGTVIGNYAWSPGAGPRAGALEFNGTNTFVSVPDAPQLDNTTALTLAFWLRANATTSGGAGLISKRNAISDNNAFTTFLQNDRLINVDLDGSTNRFTSVTALNLGAWYHVAITFDGAQAMNQRARIYINGALERVVAEGSPAIPDYNSTLKIGLTHSNATTYLNGALGDVRIYRRALSATEVAALAVAGNAPSAVSGPAPVVSNSVPALLEGSVVNDQPGPLSTRWSLLSGPGPAGFADPGDPATSVTFTGAGPYVLRLSASNAVASVFDELPVNVGANPNVYADWIALEFPGQTNLLVVGTVADPDLDGAKNLLEFVLGMAPGTWDAVPFQTNAPGLPVGGLKDFTGTNRLFMAVRRVAGRIGVRCQAEVSGDLVNWSDALLVPSILTNSDGSEVLTFADPVNAAEALQRYIRLRVDAVP